jgi:glycogen debranching enzyme
MKWALKLYGPIRIRGALDPSRTKESIGEFKKALDIINLPIYHRLDDDINSICRNITERIRYERLASHGPQKGNLSEASPLVEPYFTAIKKSDKIVTWAANNGWVWGGNPLENFADPPARAYFRRDVIIWADSVKLR